LELARFAADPEGYRTASDKTAEKAAGAVAVDDARTAAFLTHLATGGRSRVYLGIVRAYLGAWGEALAGGDLRRLEAKGLRKMLAAWPTARKHRIIAFKSFCGWLERQGELDPRDNPGRFLTVPTARRTHEAKGYAIADVEAMYRALPTQYIRDLLCLQANTGMHVTEADRLARAQGMLREVADCAPIAGTIAFPHKTGARHVLSVNAQTLAAAKRLIVTGRAPSIHAVHDAVDLAVAKAKKNGKTLKPINFGALRHSFTTWAVEHGREVQPRGMGLSVEKVAERLGHTNTRTTRLHYLDVSVPPMIVVPIALRHPDDPAWEEVATGG
jgi:integrase